MEGLERSENSEGVCDGVLLTPMMDMGGEGGLLSSFVGMVWSSWLLPVVAGSVVASFSGMLSYIGSVGWCDAMCAMSSALQ